MLQPDSVLKFEPLLLRAVEVAQLMGCSRAQAYRLMQLGLIPTIRLPGGKSVRVPRERFLQWIEANTRADAVRTVDDGAVSR